VLVKAFTVGGNIDHVVIIALVSQCGDATVDGFDLHHHAGKPAVGIIVYPAPLVVGVVAKVMQVDFGQTFLLCPGQNGLVDKAFEHFGQHSDNVYSHEYPFF